jgi:hypothetical protein
MSISAFGGLSAFAAEPLDLPSAGSVRTQCLEPVQYRQKVNGEAAGLTKMQKIPKPS